MASIADSIAQTLLVRFLVEEGIDQIDGFNQLVALVPHNLIHVVIRKLFGYTSDSPRRTHASYSEADRKKCPCNRQGIC